MKYEVLFTKEAEKDINRLRESEPAAFKKLVKLVAELYDHPMTGTGKPEMLKGNRIGQWSRRITKRHRLVYEINGDKIYVYVLSAYGHY